MVLGSMTGSMLGSMLGSLVLGSSVLGSWVLGSFVLGSLVLGGLVLGRMLEDCMGGLVLELVPQFVMDLVLCWGGRVQAPLALSSANLLQAPLALSPTNLLRAPLALYSMRLLQANALPSANLFPRLRGLRLHLDVGEQLEQIHPHLMVPTARTNLRKNGDLQHVFMLSPRTHKLNCWLPCLICCSKPSMPVHQQDRRMLDRPQDPQPWRGLHLEH